MSQLTAIAPASATAPLVQLVGLDGSPIEPAAPRPAAAAWPAWTDLVRVRLGASDDGLERHRLSVGIGDALTGLVWRADNLGRIDPADDDGLAAFDARHPVRTPQVAPISGGSPDAETSTSASDIDLNRLDAVARGLYGDAPTSAE